MNLLHNIIYFITACKKGNVQELKKLLDGPNHGININNGLDSAVTHDQFDVVKYLIEKGADPAFKRGIALLLSARYGHTKIALFLLDNFLFDKEILNDALEEALNSNHFSIFRCLAREGACVREINIENVYCFMESLFTYHKTRVDDAKTSYDYCLEMVLSND